MSIETWLEARTGATRRQMALQVGQSPSTFNRNIESAEVIVAVCRAYKINPVEGLIAAGIITQSEAAQVAATVSLSDVTEKELLHEMLRRVNNGPATELRRPITSDDIDGALGADPDYSSMTEKEAEDYGLAAHKGDSNIAFDDLPHEP
ncbi:hypothetical protein [Glutamicibacter arilaitensis]|uniref:hypothetical protein n=1 Tax=Glutamicibacter arilaitensis TaxID=256701 RepID=UPI00384C3E14